jgi:hypothetical protein
MEECQGSERLGGQGRVEYLEKVLISVIRFLDYSKTMNELNFLMRQT